MGEGRTEPVGRRLTVAQAAEELGISAEAVRGRIRRGTLPVSREGGTVYVLLDDAYEPRTTDDQTPDRTDLLIAEMQDRIRSLEEANRENRRIIAALTSRIPELEPARGEESSPFSQEPRESPVTPAEEAGGTEETPLPWWRRWFQSR